MTHAPERIQVMVCTRCEGSGSEGIRRCGICKGIGRGAMHGNRFLYWGVRIDSFTLLLAKVRVAVDTVYTLGAVFLVGYGAYLLGKRIAAEGVASALRTAFWLEPNNAVLAFWTGTAAALFLVYRAAVATAHRQYVAHRVYGEDEEDQAVREVSWEDVVRLPKRSRIDVSRAYAPQTVKAVVQAFRLARQTGKAEARTPHLFVTLLDTLRIRLVFGRLGLAFGNIKDELASIVHAGPTDERRTVLSDGVHAALLSAYVEARLQKQPLVDVTDLFIAVMRADEQLQELLYGHDADVNKVENVIHWIRLEHQLRERYRRFSSAARHKPKGAMNRAMTSVATPFLDRLSEDLTRSAVNFRLEPSVGRERELSAVFRGIEGGQKSIVLVGHPGTGTTSIVEAIAQRMVEEDVPSILQDKRLLSLDIPRLVAGATPAEAQERLLAALYEVARAGNIVLAVPHVAGMTGIAAGGGEAIDLSQVLANELAKGYFFAIATATPDEFSGGIEGSALAGALVRVDVPEPEEDDAIRMLQSKIAIIEYRNNVMFSYDAVAAAVELTGRYLHDAFLPEKAIEAAKEAANAARRARGDGTRVGREDVAQVVSEKANVPLTQLTSDESARLLALEDELHGRVIGQQDAVSAVAAAMRRSGAEMRSKDRPIANFLFLGPTGVGKTELAKALAQARFGAEDAMIRLDMSEYQDPEAIYKLIGEPAGDEGGILTEAVRRQPFSLVLLDEIEKADKDVLTAFLQVMDEGRLTDNTGRTIDLTNTIIIATSNAGAQAIQDGIREGLNPKQVRDRLVNEELKHHFRPEFLNRFDEIIVFTPLTEEELMRITRLMLKKVESRLDEKGIRFVATDEAVAELAHAGYDPAFGARPLRRVIQDRVDNALADILLKGEAKRRDTLVYDVGGEISIEKPTGA